MPKKPFGRSLAILCLMVVAIISLVNASQVWNEAVALYGRDHVSFWTTTRVIVEMVVGGVAFCYGLVLKYRP
ncbi:MAG TPA: hypothetical protein VLG09_04175 [Candidatus Saccharimonadales bacterium]|nr:hypothetical protein [Candidatus Saccharimonadales bacterium]